MLPIHNNGKPTNTRAKSVGKKRLQAQNQHEHHSAMTHKQRLYTDLTRKHARDKHNVSLFIFLFIFNSRQAVTRHHTAPSKSVGATTRLSRTDWIFVTMFNTAACSCAPGVSSWARFISVCMHHHTNTITCAIGECSAHSSRQRSSLQLGLQDLAGTDFHLDDLSELSHMAFSSIIAL